ncbi:MAG: enoyl-CoA hydratase-related protein [Vicinamibacterales bacterium]
MAYQHLAVAQHDGVVRLTLNRPALRNAFNGAMVAELTDWAVRTAADPGARVAVIAGAGPTFCAGGDLAWMAQTARFTFEENVQDAIAASRMFTAIDRLHIPVIARIQGGAFGGGAGLASVCDVVVSERDATFGFTEVKLGIVPAVIAPFVLAKIGRSAARELFLTGRRFSAQHALEIGLAHTLAARADLDTAVDAVVAEILQAGPEAIAAAKALIAGVWDRGHAAATALTTKTLA